MAAIASYPYVAYKATKAALIAFTEQLAYQNARHGIRANVILPGLIDTPMAVDTRAREFNRSGADVEAERDAQVLLRKKMRTAWDVANAALFLASDEANFITVALPVRWWRRRAAGLVLAVCQRNTFCDHGRRNRRDQTSAGADSGATVRCGNARFHAVARGFERAAASVKFAGMAVVAVGWSFLRGPAYSSCHFSCKLHQAVDAATLMVPAWG